MSQMLSRRRRIGVAELERDAGTFSLDGGNLVLREQPATHDVLAVFTEGGVRMAGPLWAHGELVFGQTFVVDFLSDHPSTATGTYFVGFQGFPAGGSPGMLTVPEYELPAKWKKGKPKAVYTQLETDLKKQKAKLDKNVEVLGKDVGRDVHNTARLRSRSEPRCTTCAIAHDLRSVFHCSR